MCVLHFHNVIQFTSCGAQYSVPHTHPVCAQDGPPHVRDNKTCGPRAVLEQALPCVADNCVDSVGGVDAVDAVDGVDVVDAANAVDAVVGGTW